MECDRAGLKPIKGLQLAACLCLGHLDTIGIPDRIPVVTSCANPTLKQAQVAKGSVAQAQVGAVAQEGLSKTKAAELARANR